MKKKKNSNNNSSIKNNKFLKLNLTKNNRLYSFHKTYTIPKIINENTEKSISINKKSKTNKSSSRISPQKSPLILQKNKNNIKKLINMVNIISKQKNKKSKNYQSEKFLKRNKLLFRKDNNKKILKIKDIKKFQEYSSYLRNRNNKIEIKSNKTEFNDTIKKKIKDKESKTINENKSNIKETIYHKVKEKEKHFESKSENEKTNINKKILVRASNISFKNKIYKSEPKTQIVKPIKKRIQIPNKNFNNNFNNNNISKKEQFPSNKINSQNNDLNNNFSFLKKFNNLIINPNNYYKTSNNSIISNYNNENTYILRTKNNSKNIPQKKNKEKKEFKNNNSLSIKKIGNTNKYLSSNDIRLKRKKNIFNIIRSINNKTEKKYQKIIKRNINKNKFNSNFQLYDTENNKNISYYSFISSNSQINIRANKNFYKNKFKNKNEDTKELQNTCILLYKRKINDLNSYNKENNKESIYKKNIYTEKNQEKNKILHSSLRNSFKKGKKTKSKKIENRSDMSKEKHKNNNKKLNYKKVFNLLSENKENNNLNLKEKKKNNIDKIKGNKTYCIKKKSKNIIDNNI